MTSEERARIASILGTKVGNRPCARCGQAQFVIEGYGSLSILPDLNNFGNLFVGGPVVPVVVTICIHCGAVYQHALGPLGLLPKPEAEAK